MEIFSTFFQFPKFVIFHGVLLLISKHYKLFYEKYYMNSLKYIQTVICSLIIHNIDNTVMTSSTQLYVFILILKIGM